MLENITTEISLSDTPGNIFNIDKSGIQINEKPASVITEKVSKCVCVLTPGEENENVLVIACAENENVLVIACAYVAVQFLPPS
jgi:hypothetical protein